MPLITTHSHAAWKSLFLRCGCELDDGTAFSEYAFKLGPFICSVWTTTSLSWWKVDIGSDGPRWAFSCMALGDGGDALRGSGNGDVSHLMNSLGPLLQHLAGALQQSGAPMAPQQQVLF